MSTARYFNELKDWAPFLLKNSGLPGPRGNLELAQVVAEEGTRFQFEQFLSFQAAENTPEVFVIFCGMVGLGKLAALGEHELFARLRAYASDQRWRVRESVAIALQYVGDKDMKVLQKQMRTWSLGNWYEKRAVVAAFAEPRLLKEPETVSEILNIFDRITTDMASARYLNDEGFKALRKSLGYCWSVAVAASPKEGKKFMEKWLGCENPGVRWIMKENLKKHRLEKMDPIWVKACQARL